MSDNHEPGNFIAWLFIFLAVIWAVSVLASFTLLELMLRIGGFQ